LHNYALAILILCLIGFIFGSITTLAGFVLALIKAPEVQDGYL